MRVLLPGRFFVGATTTAKRRARRKTSPPVTPVKIRQPVGMLSVFVNEGMKQVRELGR
jgi:hypothetical protein